MNPMQTKIQEIVLDYIAYRVAPQYLIPAAIVTIVVITAIVSVAYLARKKA